MLRNYHLSFLKTILLSQLNEAGIPMEGNEQQLPQSGCNTSMLLSLFYNLYIHMYIYMYLYTRKKNIYLHIQKTEKRHS